MTEKNANEEVHHVTYGLELNLQNYEHSGMPHNNTIGYLQIHLGRTFEICVIRRKTVLLLSPSHFSSFLYLPPSPSKQTFSPTPPSSYQQYHFVFLKSFKVFIVFLYSYFILYVRSGQNFLHLAKACFENWREKKDIQHDL
jgi:hypothetical protein